MRTLLTDPFPRHFANEKTFSPRAEPSPPPAGKPVCTFPQAAVLTSVDDLLEVGVDGTAIATPGASVAAQTATAPERGVAIASRPASRVNDVSSSPRTAVAECDPSAENALTA